MSDPQETGTERSIAELIVDLNRHREDLQDEREETDPESPDRTYLDGRIKGLGKALQMLEQLDDWDLPEWQIGIENIETEEWEWYYPHAVRREEAVEKAMADATDDLGRRGRLNIYELSGPAALRADGSGQQHGMPALRQTRPECLLCGTTCVPPEGTPASEREKWCPECEAPRSPDGQPPATDGGQPSTDKYEYTIEVEPAPAPQSIDCPGCGSVFLELIQDGRVAISGGTCPDCDVWIRYDQGRRDDEQEDTTEQVTLGEVDDD